MSGGLAYYKKTDYDRAIADYNRAIEIDPKYARAYGNRGLAYYKKTDYDRAIADYKRSVAIFEKAVGPDHPNVAPSLNNLAIAYRAQGRTAEAEPLDKRALAIWGRRCARLSSRMLGSRLSDIPTRRGLMPITTNSPSGARVPSDRCWLPSMRSIRHASRPSGEASRN